MAPIEPDGLFAREVLQRIFRIAPNHPDRIISRESSWLEFKENFNWKSWEKYGRTMAAYANTSGGYLVFGVGDNPRCLIGMQNDYFESTSPEKIAQDLNSAFSPEIQWDSHVHTMDGKKFGLLYVHENTARPVIATKTIRDGKKIKEGEIYYRYRARSERIKYAELRNIIEERHDRNLKLWLEFIQRVAKVGVENAAILDTLQGTISGPGGRLLIDESLLSQIEFIREGEFDERDGAPTLRLIGDVQPIQNELVQPVRLKDKFRSIQSHDIVNAFLEQTNVSHPREFIKHMCTESSMYLPIYYFMGLAGLTRTQTIDLIDAQVTRSPTKARLIERLGDDEKVRSMLRLDTGSKVAESRQGYRQQILEQTLATDLDPSEIRYALQAIRTLEPDEIDAEYVLPIVKGWYNEFFESGEVNPHEFRMTICYLDYHLHFEEATADTNS